MAVLSVDRNMPAVPRVTLAAGFKVQSGWNLTAVAAIPRDAQVWRLIDCHYLQRETQRGKANNKQGE